jgi:hypothetical protein
LQVESAIGNHASVVLLYSSSFPQSSHTFLVWASDIFRHWPQCYNNCGCLTLLFSSCGLYTEPFPYISTPFAQNNSGTRHSNVSNQSPGVIIPQEGGLEI